MTSQDAQYLSLGRYIQEEGFIKDDRTGTGTTSVFGTSMKFDISDNKLPLLTSKKVFHKGIIHELLWMLSGSTDIGYLLDNDVHIWDSWVDPESAEYEYFPIKKMSNILTNHLSIDSISVSTTYDPTIDEMKIGKELNNSDDDTHHCHYSILLPTKEKITLEQAYSIIYKMELGCEPKKLVGGNLKHIYQEQWRSWKDTRIIPSKETSKYVENGYAHITSFDSDQAVVHREFDQVQYIIDRLKSHPDCRRIILSAWNSPWIEDMSLAPCHLLVQFWTRELTVDERIKLMSEEQYLSFEDTLKDANYNKNLTDVDDNHNLVLSSLKQMGIPERALQIQMYQR